MISNRPTIIFGATLYAGQSDRWIGRNREAETAFRDNAKNEQVLDGGRRAPMSFLLLIIVKYCFLCGRQPRLLTQSRLITCVATLSVYLWPIVEF